MKKFLVALFLVVSLFISQSSQILSATKSTVDITSVKYLEWVEYVLIEDQWYQITHLDDGGIIITPVASPIRD